MYVELLAQLRKDEGLRLKAYHCPAGKLTIGYGHNLESAPYFKSLLIPLEIDKAMAEALLQNDVAITERRLVEQYPHFHRLDAPRQDALLNMAFQLGVNGLMRFKRMLAALDAGHYDQAYVEALDSNWAKQTPARAQRVARQIMYGEYQTL